MNGPLWPTTDRLDSWKQIAAYLQRGVRTVRRWETEEGLPVHRHLHRVLGSVYAYKSEIDEWEKLRRDRVPRRLSVGHVAAESSDERSLAVLPFANLSRDPENGYFADGLTEEITAGLSVIRSLRVISRTSASAFRGSVNDAKAISHALGVRYLLEGSVRRAGDRLRITARLIDSSTDAHLWAESFDGNIEDVFAIQERISRLIADALELRLTSDEDRKLQSRGIDDIHAYECYLRARQQGWRWRKDAIDQAIQLLRNGLALIGDNARLYAALGIAWLQYREAGVDFGESVLLEAENCARHAFEIEGESAAVLQLRGWIHYARGETQEAVRDLKSALHLEPNNADTLLLLSNCYLIAGRVEAGRLLIDRLVSVDPLTPLTRCMPAWASILEGDFASAIEPYRQMFEMDPGNPMARLFYVWVLLLNGRAEMILPILKTFPPEVIQTVPAEIAFFLGNTIGNESDETVLPELSEKTRMAATFNDVFARKLAGAYARANEVEPAMHWLETAVQRGFINYPFLSRLDPFLENLKSEPRFLRLMETVKDRWKNFEA